MWRAFWVSSRTHRPRHQTADGFRRRRAAPSKIYAGGLFFWRRLVSARRREPIVREQFGALERMPPQEDRGPQSLQIQESCGALRL
jgi:hypothetical protein